MDAVFLFFPTGDKLANTFAEHFVNWIQEQEQHDLHIALSGGSTPKTLFAILAQEPYNSSIPCNRLHFYWGDERCVAPDHADSNYGMTHAILLSQIDIPAENIHRSRGEDNPEDEAKRYSEEITKNVLNSAFDLIMLGMGDDGHTASIFPHEMHLLENPNVCAVATHPVSGQKRITLTGTTLNSDIKYRFIANVFTAKVVKMP